MSHPTRALRGASALPYRERGLSLIELMVALALGMLIMAALSALFLGITRNNSELAKANAQIENGRFAIQILQNDLVHAGLWGELRPAAPSALPDPCKAVANWTADDKVNMLGAPVVGYSSTTIATTLCAISGAQVSSDVVVIRHANTCVAGAANCEGGNDTGPHIQVSRCTASQPQEAAYVIDSTTFPLRGKDCATIAERRKFVSNIYYVSNNSLMRKSLVNGVYQVPAPLVDGIEALKFEYGIDSSGDGVPDSYEACTPCSAAQTANITAVKVHVLARSLEASPGYTDSKSYQLGSTSYTPAATERGFKRHVFSTTVRLVNPSGRREVP